METDAEFWHFMKFPFFVKDPLMSASNLFVVNTFLAWASNDVSVLNSTLVNELAGAMLQRKRNQDKKFTNPDVLTRLIMWIVK